MNNKRPKLVVDVRMIENSGIGTVIKNILPYIIQSDKFEVILMGYIHSLNKLVWTKNTKIVPMKSKIYSIFEQIELNFKIPNCELFWSPHYNIPVFPIKAKHRIVTIHDVYHLAFNQNLKLFEKMYARAMMYFAVSRSNTITTVSNFSKNQINQYLNVNLKKISIIYNGVNKSKDIGQNTPIDSQYILFVGNIKPHKNIVKAIEGYKIAKQYYPNLKFFIVGRNEDLLNQDLHVKNLVCGDNSIQLTGEVSNEILNDYYRGATLLIFPSIYEGFGLPILEAMNYKLPIICSDIPVFKELFADSVLMFNPHSPQEIANKIIMVLKKEWSPNISQYELILDKFSWSKSQEKYFNLFLKTSNYSNEC